MIWVLIAAFGLASWLSAAMLILGLFRAARIRPLESVDDAAAPARGGGSYLSSLESRRSLRSLPSVWQVGQ